MERRARRFPLHLSATVRWTTGSGIAEAKTHSQDVSSRGIYFFLPKRIADGSAVEILLSLPHEFDVDARPHVLCKGRVQRTEVLADRVGVAARIESYEFVHGSGNEGGYRSSAPNSAANS